MLKDVQQHSFSPDDHAALRAQVRDVLGAEGLSQAAGARAAGIANSTFAAWLAGTYQGDDNKVAGSVQIWLASRLEHAKTAQQVPQAPGYLALPTAVAITDTLRFAQSMPDFVVVAAAPGIGKTTAATQYARTNPNVWMVTVQPATATRTQLVQEIAEALGVDERNQSRLLRGVQRKLRDAVGGLLIIDEAQHLELPALEQLRSLHDLQRIGVAATGSQAVYTRIEGRGRGDDLAQLYSRLGDRIIQNKPRAGDVAGLLDAWGIAAEDCRQYLAGVALRGGALRTVTKVLRLASMLAVGAGLETPSLKLIRSAYERLSSASARAE
jgi:DNA transposition AAA+ family ATPase